jgi:hypothetical protein
MQRDIESTLWGRPDFRKLSPDARFLYVYLRTNHHTHLSGLYFIHIEDMMADTGMDKDQVIKALEELDQHRIAHYDPEVAYIWVLGFLRFRSPKLDQAVVKHLNKYVPETPLVEAFLETFSHYKPLINRENMVSKSASLSYPINRVKIPYKYPFGVISISKSISVSKKEGGVGGGKKSASPKNKPKAKGKKKLKAAPPPERIAVSYPSFDLPESYYKDLLTTYAALGEDKILVELRKASIYAQDWPEKYERLDGIPGAKMVRYRTFINNWLNRALKDAGGTAGTPGPDASGYQPVDPNCPICDGTGIEHFERDGETWGKICRCRLPGHKPAKGNGNGRKAEAESIGPAPGCDCDNGLRTGPDGKAEICDCIKKQIGGGKGHGKGVSVSGSC